MNYLLSSDSNKIMCIRYVRFDEVVMIVSFLGNRLG